MTGSTKKNKKSVLKKEHFEILLEDIRDKFKFLAEGHIMLNDKIVVLDKKIDSVADELHTTRDDLILFIKSSIEHSEERLTQKLQDGDNAVIEKLSRQIQDGDNAVIEKLSRQIQDGDNTVTDKLGKQINEVRDLLKSKTDKIDDHEHRIAALEQKLN